MIPEFSIRQPIPKRGACDPNPYEADRKNQSGLPAPSGFQSGWIRKHPIDPHRIGDVLDLAIAKRLVTANKLVLDLLVNPTGDVDLAGLRKSFETRSNIDAITIDVVLFDDHVA